MHIGIPKEIKDYDIVAATPPGVAALVAAGHRVYVETGAGTAIGFTDADYRSAGANLTDVAGVYAAELIFKVNNRSPPKWRCCTPGNGRW